jgi:hypothetical protein
MHTGILDNDVCINCLSTGTGMSLFDEYQTKNFHIGKNLQILDLVLDPD